MNQDDAVWWVVRQRSWGNPYASSVHLLSKTGKSTACGVTLGDKGDVRRGPVVVTCASCHKRFQARHVKVAAGTFSPRLRRKASDIRQKEITAAIARFKEGGGQIEHGPTYPEPLRNTVAWGHGGYINPFEVL